jgi:hypothetical protein
MLTHAPETVIFKNWASASPKLCLSTCRVANANLPSRPVWPFERPSQIRA